MEILEVLRRVEADGSWVRLLFIGVPLDAITFAFVAYTAGGLTWRFGGRSKKSDAIAVVVATVTTYLIYFLLARPLLLRSVAFRVFPYLAVLTIGLFLMPALFAESDSHTWTKLRLVVADFTPDLTRTLRVASLFGGMLALAIVTPYDIGHWQWPSEWRTSTLNFIARNVFDAGWLQTFTAVMLIAITHRYYASSASRVKRLASPKLLTIFLAVVVGIALVAATAVAAALVRPNFEPVHIPDALPAGRLTEYVTQLLGLPRDGNAQAPSGFAIRQTILALLVLVLTQQKDWRCVFKRTAVRIGIQLLLWSISLLVLADRLYLGHSEPRSMGVGIAVGVMLFWLVAPGAVFIARSTLEHYNAFVRAIAPLWLYTFGLWVACNFKIQWLVTSVGLYVVYGIALIVLRKYKFILLNLDRAVRG